MCVACPFQLHATFAGTIDRHGILRHEKGIVTQRTRWRPGI
jgi:hypothetical protein